MKWLRRIIEEEIRKMIDRIKQEIIEEILERLSGSQDN